MVKESIQNMQDPQQKEVYKKFSKGHWLSDKSHVEALMMMTTYYRKNLNRFASEYLGLKLHLYQAIWLYLMGISSVFVCIASRAASKSYVIAIYSVCMPYRDWETDRKSTRLNSSHSAKSRMPSSA